MCEFSVICVSYEVDAEENKSLSEVDSPLVVNAHRGHSPAFAGQSRPVSSGADSEYAGDVRCLLISQIRPGAGSLALCSGGGVPF